MTCRARERKLRRENRKVKIFSEKENSDVIEKDLAESETYDIRRIRRVSTALQIETLKLDKRKFSRNRVRGRGFSRPEPESEDGKNEESPSRETENDSRPRRRYTREKDGKQSIKKFWSPRHCTKKFCFSLRPSLRPCLRSRTPARRTSMIVCARARLLPRLFSRRDSSQQNTIRWSSPVKTRNEEETVEEETVEEEKVEDETFEETRLRRNANVSTPFANPSEILHIEIEIRHATQIPKKFVLETELKAAVPKSFTFQRAAHFITGYWQRLHY